MTQIIFELVKESQNNGNNALQEIIDRFRPTIRKFSRQLNYDCAESDLIISLIEIVRNIHLDKLIAKNDQIIVSLISKALKYRKIDLFRKHVLNSKEMYELDLNLSPALDTVNEDIENRLIFMHALKALSPIQRFIIVNKYFRGYSDAIIADKLKISRQAVNSAKNRALARLSKILDI